MTKPRPLDPRVLLKDVALEQIKRLILEGTLAPGRVVSERELTGMLSMSKTPIRAALERLALEGFVHVSPQRGVMVLEMSLQEIVDHYDLRHAVETFVVARIAGRLDREQCEVLRDHLLRQDMCIHDGDARAYISADGDFHQQLCLFDGNRQIIDVMRLQREKLARVGEQIARRDPARMQVSAAEHARIVAAIEEGDSIRAARCMAEHLENGKRFLVAGATRGLQLADSPPPVLPAGVPG
jgi:DNA-binding GntR family transcriptional regulator